MTNTADRRARIDPQFGDINHAALCSELAALCGERDNLGQKCDVLQGDASYWMKKAKQLKQRCIDAESVVDECRVGSDFTQDLAEKHFEKYTDDLR